MLRVHDPLLEQAVVQPHDHPAVDLALPGQPVDDQPRVLDGDDLLDPDHAGLDIDGRPRRTGSRRRPTLASPSVKPPVSEIEAMPSLRQASFQPMMGSPLTQSWPPLSDRSSAVACEGGSDLLEHGVAGLGHRVEAGRGHRWAWWSSRRRPGPGGKVELPMFEMMSVGFSPRTSAAMIARTVRMPVPRSWVAVLSSTEPSGLIVQLTFLSWPPAAAPLVQGHAQAVADRPAAVLAARLALLAPADQLGPELDLALVDRGPEVALKAKRLADDAQDISHTYRSGLRRRADVDGDPATAVCRSGLDPVRRRRRRTPTASSTCSATCSSASAPTTSKSRMTPS